MKKLTFILAFLLSSSAFATDVQCYLGVMGEDDFEFVHQFVASKPQNSGRFDNTFHYLESSVVFSDTGEPMLISLYDTNARAIAHAFLHEEPTFRNWLSVMLTTADMTSMATTYILTCAKIE